MVFLTAITHLSSLISVIKIGITMKIPAMKEFLVGFTLMRMQKRKIQERKNPSFNENKNCVSSNAKRSM